MAKTRPRRGSAYHLTPSFELFRFSRDLVLKNIWIFGPLYIVPLIFQIHSWLWSPSGPNAPHHWWGGSNSFSPGLSSSPTPFFSNYAFVGFSVFWLLFVLVAGFIILIMTQAAQLKASEDKIITFGVLWNVVKDIGWRMVGLYIVVGLTILVGFILLIIPGLIFLRRYYLSAYVMLDKKVGIREAMDRSAAMTKPHSGSVWGVIGVTVLIALTGVIPFIGWLIAFTLGMLYSVAPALRYQELNKL